MKFGHVYACVREVKANNILVCEKKFLLCITYQNSLQDIFDIFIGREGAAESNPPGKSSLAPVYWGMEFKGLLCDRQKTRKDFVI